jgi:acetyl esterase/lipase
VAGVSGLQRQVTRLLLRLPGPVLLRLAGGPPPAVAGRTLDPACALLAAQGRRGPHLADQTPEVARRLADAGMRLLAGPPRRVRAIEKVELRGPGGPLPARLYRPHGLAGPAPLLLYFHQGGFVVGNLDWAESFCTILADTAKCLVLSVDYRLAPEHRFPAPCEDALAAWRWACGHAGGIGGDPRRLAVGGDSAGGNLAAMLTHEAKRAGGVQPVFQLLIYPWVVARGHTPSYDLFADAYPLDRRLVDWFAELAFEKPEQMEDLRVCPLNQSDFARLPPALVATAGFDPLCDEGRLYAEKLAAAGVSVTYRCFESLCHSFAAMGAVPAAARAQVEIAEALRRALQ